MAIVNDNRLEISKLDFDGIKSNLKTFLQSQTEFTDYDFDGSGMSVLLDVLSYNTHYMSYYLNMVGNEMFLDSAINRDSIVSIAKQMGYVPKSTTAAQALLSFTANVAGGAATATIPAWTKFSVVSDRTKYIFQPAADVTVSTSSGVATFNNVVVKEGTYLKNIWTYNDDGKKQRFVIPNAGIDTSTLKVTVKSHRTASETDTYKLYTDLESLTSTSKVYFLQEIEDGLYEVYFGDGVYGIKPSSNNVITVEYLVTSGDGGNYAGRDLLQKFKLEDSLTDSGAGTPTISGDITTSSYASGGAAAESIESIRHNAPLNYSSQERLVTENDYKNIVLTKYSNAKAVRVWSGDPKRKLNTGENEESGVVYISIVPQVATRAGGLDQAAKDYVTKVLLDPYRILGIRNRIIDPNVTKLKIKSKVYYNSALGDGKSADSLKNRIISEIKTFSSTNLETFENAFRYSKLMYTIDQADKSILSNETSIRYSAQTRLSPNPNSTGGWDYERSANGRRGGIDQDYKYARLKPFSFDVTVDKGSIVSDWFWVHVLAINPHREMGRTYDFTGSQTTNKSHWAWQKDIETFNWDDPDYDKPVGTFEYVSLVKVRFIDDKRRASVYMNNNPNPRTDQYYVGYSDVNVDGKGFIYLQTAGGHMVPFQRYDRQTPKGLDNFNNDDITFYPDGLGLDQSMTGNYIMGYNFALVDYGNGQVANIKPIPIFGFDKDLTFTLYTNEEKALQPGGGYAKGSVVLNQTKKKEEDRDVLNVNVELWGDNRDVIPATNTIISLDSSTLADDIELVEDKKRSK